jgi:hypothetical protein
LDGRAESLHNDFPQNLPSQDTFGADKAASDPLQENNPVIVIGDVPNLEVARTDSLSDDMNQFILKRRAAVPENCEIINLLKTISNSVRKSLSQMMCQESLCICGTSCCTRSQNIFYGPRI